MYLAIAASKFHRSAVALAAGRDAPPASASHRLRQHSKRPPAGRSPPNTHLSHHRTRHGSLATNTETTCAAQARAQLGESCAS